MEKRKIMDDLHMAYCVYQLDEVNYANFRATYKEFSSFLSKITELLIKNTNNDIHLSRLINTLQGEHTNDYGFINDSVNRFFIYQYNYGVSPERLLDYIISCHTQYKKIINSSYKVDQYPGIKINYNLRRFYNLAIIPINNEQEEIDDWCFDIELSPDNLIQTNIKFYSRSRILFDSIQLFDSKHDKTLFMNRLKTKALMSLEHYKIIKSLSCTSKNDNESKLKYEFNDNYISKQLPLIIIENTEN